MLRLAVCLFVAVGVAQSFENFNWKWQAGRATFYGLDQWSIMKGGCNYGYLGLNEVRQWRPMLSNAHLGRHA